MKTILSFIMGMLIGSILMFSNAALADPPKVGTMVETGILCQAGEVDGLIAALATGDDEIASAVLMGEYCFMFDENAEVKVLGLYASVFHQKGNINHFVFVSPNIIAISVEVEEPRYRPRAPPDDAYFKI